jgi:hypothetical protein
MGQKAPQGPASHPLGFKTDVGRQKSVALIFLILFSSRKKECLAASIQKKYFLLFSVATLKIS